MAIVDYIRLKVEGDAEIDKLRKAVIKTKWFARFDPEELSLEVLENGYKKVSTKYEAGIGYVRSGSEESWTFMVKDFKTHEWVETIAALTLYEGLCKTILVLYGYIEKGMLFQNKERRER